MNLLNFAKKQSFNPPRGVDIVWLILLTLYVFAGVSTAPLHGDESTQIYMGHDFYYQFVQRNLSLVMYSENPGAVIEDGKTQQQLRLLNGTLPKYLFGAAAYLGGYGTDDINEQWLWGAGWEHNHQNNHVPSDDLLLRTRFMSAGLLAAGTITMFGIGYTLRGRLLAYIASLFFALNPVILLNGRRAMMESGMITFSLLAILAALWILQKRSEWTYMLLGVASGLAVASKHTSLITVLVIFLVSAILIVLQSWHSKNRQEGNRSFAGLFAAGILSLLVFYALNPAWWDNPAGRISDVLMLRHNLLSGQIDAFGGYETLRERVSGFVAQTLSGTVMYAETELDDFLIYLEDEIKMYEQSIVSGIQLTGVGAILRSVLIGVGILRLWQDAQMTWHSRCLIGVWLAVMVGFVFFVTPLEWQRYYLPAYPVISLVMSIGLVYTLTNLRRWWHRQQKIRHRLINLLSSTKTHSWK